VDAVTSAPIIELRPQAAGDALSDAGLAAAVVAGDRAARAQLFERHVDAVHRFVSRMRGSDPDAVEDLVQAVFLAAFQAAASFHGDHLRGWLFGIAANKVREYARREIRRKRAHDAVEATAPRATELGSPHVIARLPAALAALPEELREVLILIDLEGERGRDAAEALGIPEGTLWRRVHLGRRAVREALGGDP
jgi:RNA polymerase sigma-70 factor (ECF subfamily)